MSNIQQRQEVIHKTSNATLTADECSGFTTITNRGATGAITLTLPPCSNASRLHVLKIEDFEITVNTSDNIISKGNDFSTIDIGKNDEVVLVGLDSDNWYSTTNFLMNKYWRAYKTSGAGGGGYHSELEVYVGATQQTLTTGMLTQSGLSMWNAGQLIDGNTGTHGFHTDSSGVGSYVQIEFAVPTVLTRWRFYASAATSAIWRIDSSGDGVEWATLATGLDCTTGGWHEVSF